MVFMNNKNKSTREREWTVSWSNNNNNIQFTEPFRVHSTYSCMCVCICMSTHTHTQSHTNTHRSLCLESPCLVWLISSRKDSKEKEIECPIMSDKGRKWKSQHLFEESKRIWRKLKYYYRREVSVTFFNDIVVEEPSERCCLSTCCLRSVRSVKI